jgi:hypothetical protein
MRQNGDPVRSQQHRGKYSCALARSAGVRDVRAVTHPRTYCAKCIDVTAAADVSAQQHASTMIPCSESAGWQALFCTGAVLDLVPAPDVAR